MKFLKLMLLALVGSAVFFGCKKNEDIPVAVGTLLNDSTGDCREKFVHGVYFPGTGLLASNYIDVQADISSVGTYSVKTDTLNGYYFEGVGRVGNTGLNMIRLYAHGLPGPIAAPYTTGINTFTVQFDYADSTNTGGGACTVDVEVISASPQTSVYIPDKDIDGGCLGAIATGVYEVNTALDSLNSVTIRVNVLAEGTYDFSTSEINGMTFTATGLFLSKGVQTIKLIGSGVPLKEGIYNVSVKQGTVSCKFSVTVVPFGGGGPVAEFSMGGSPGNCGGFVPEGVYSVGTPLNPSNTVTTDVNVTTAGAYSITTPIVNGIKFNGAGTFTTTGVQQVILTGTGTPVTEGESIFIATGGGTTCSFSITSGGSTGGPATFTFSGAPGACTGSSLEGTYTAGTALTPANTATIQVNVTTVGSYSISTNNVNGIAFSAAGTFVTTGIQSVTLLGTGTPVAAGDNTYLLSPADGCSFIVTTGSPAPPAVYTAPINLCSSAIINGTYRVGTSLGLSNTISITVDVTTAGSYSISTSPVNGMTFSASGTFASTGSQNIELKGSGTPVAAGDILIPITIGSVSCNFSVTVNAAVVGAGVLTCKIDNVFTSFNDRAAAELTDLFGLPYLYLNGYTDPPNGQEIPQLQLFINNNDNSPVGTGSYNVDGYLVPGYRIEVDYHAVDNLGAVIIWNTSSTLFPPASPPFTIVVTSITATRVKGTFSGKIKDTLQGGTNTKTITEGVFDLPIE